jgi:large subunit ribosomal protein L25
MDNVELQAKTRTVRGKKNKRLREEGWIPAVLYGSDMPSQAIKLEELPLFKALQIAGATSLIDLVVDGASEPDVVLAREIQRDILTGRLQHVDFYKVRLDQKIKTMPYLEIVGTSPLIASGEAVLVQILNQIEVECLPKDLVDSFQVDISGLETLNDSISIGDLDVPPGVTILADPGDTIISVVPPRAALVEEEEEGLEDLAMDEAFAYGEQAEPEDEIEEE